MKDVIKLICHLPPTSCELSAFKNCVIRNAVGEEKLSKIATLRLAIHYINVLENILEQDSGDESEKDEDATSKRQRLSDEETSSNTSSAELDSQGSPEGIFSNESK